MKTNELALVLQNAEPQIVMITDGKRLVKVIGYQSRGTHFEIIVEEHKCKCKGGSNG